MEIQTNPTPGELDALHRDPDNWRFYFFYVAPADPRIVVRKRIGRLGWTLNFGRPMAIPFCGFWIALFYGYCQLVIHSNFSDTVDLLGFISLIFLLGACCSWLGNPERYSSH